ncbi:MAG TPA: TonB family protein [Ohtaekwangia sp.]
MNTYLNYLMEANLGLCLFFGIYVLVLRYETDFSVKRIYALCAIVASVIFPLVHLRTGTSSAIPSLSSFIPSYWLPEVVVHGSRIATQSVSTTHSSYEFWNVLFLIYGIGVTLMLLLFLVRLIRLLITILKANSYPMGKYHVIESPKDHSSFSFFRFIFIGQASQLSNQEKQHIVNHELVHVRKLHSFDILLISILNIFFWFNPVVMLFKKIFIQLHEFEADARAVEERDVNDYCGLLARVALLSADFKLANHFSNSLTIKRIEMMRTMKTKITRWKLVALAVILPLFFFFVACQDQVTNDVVDIAKNSNRPLVVPEEVQTRYDQLKKGNPYSNYILVEFNEKAEKQLAEMEATYGLPKSIELYTPDKDEWVKGGSDSGVILERSKSESSELRTIAIIEYNDQLKEVSERSKMEGDIYTIVEQSASPVGGYESLGAFLWENLKYPQESREAGKQGTVHIQFVVNKDGSLSDFTILKSVDPLLDNEALRVTRLLPNWNPAQQDGKAVRQRFVLPLKFKLDDSPEESRSVQAEEVNSKFNLTSDVVENGNEKIVTGKLLDENNDPIKGANIVNVGSTKGTITDQEGNFRIVVPKTKGQLAVSFVGYKTETIDY